MRGRKLQLPEENAGPAAADSTSLLCGALPGLQTLGKPELLMFECFNCSAWEGLLTRAEIPLTTPNPAGPTGSALLQTPQPQVCEVCVTQILPSEVLENPTQIPVRLIVV